MKEKPKPPVHFSSNVWRALVVGLCGNISAMAAASLVLRDPPGTAIRPMDIPAYMFIIALVTAFAGIPFAVVSLFAERKVLVPLLSGLLCCAPLFTGFCVFRCLVNAFQYTLKP